MILDDCHQKHQSFWIRNDKPMCFPDFSEKFGHMRGLTKNNDVAVNSMGNTT